MATFVYMSLRTTLGLKKPYKNPSVNEVNHVLMRHFVRDRNRCDVHTFGCLEIRSDLCTQVQRVRCYPFSHDPWREGRLPRQWVLIIPPKRYCQFTVSEFDMKNQAMRDKLWVGRVELLFHSTLTGPKGELDYDFAFVSCLYDL